MFKLNECVIFLNMYAYFSWNACFVVLLHMWHLLSKCSVRVSSIAHRLREPHLFALSSFCHCTVVNANHGMCGPFSLRGSNRVSLLSFTLCGFTSDAKCVPRTCFE